MCLVTKKNQFRQSKQENKRPAYNYTEFSGKGNCTSYGNKKFWVQLSLLKYNKSQNKVAKTMHG